MNTKKILLVTCDSGLSELVRISALTLTKLNCQVSITEISEEDKAIEESSAVNLNLIIIDLDISEFDPVNLIKKIRAEKISSAKKIFSVYSSNVNTSEIHSAGCDSIMSKEDFKKVVNNILQF